MLCGAVRKTPNIDEAHIQKVAFLYETFLFYLPLIGSKGIQRGFAKLQQFVHAPHRNNLVIQGDIS